MYYRCEDCGQLCLGSKCLSCTQRSMYRNQEIQCKPINISKKDSMKMSLLKKLLSPEDRMLSKYVFTEGGNLDLDNELVQEALLKTKGFRDSLVLLVKAHDKKSKKKKECDE